MQGRMTVKEVSLKFPELSHYTLEIMSSLRARMRKFCSSLSRDSVVNCKLENLNNDIAISSMVVYMQ